MKKTFKQLRSTMLWRGANGPVLVRDMEVSHIQNTVIWLLRNKEACRQYNLGRLATEGMGVDRWVELFRTELKYRTYLASIPTLKPRKSKKVSTRPILDEAQYNNFFRLLSEIVHAEGTADKKAALLNQINREEDRRNLEIFTSWFYNR